MNLLCKCRFLKRRRPRTRVIRTRGWIIVETTNNRVASSIEKRKLGFCFKRGNIYKCYIRRGKRGHPWAFIPEIRKKWTKYEEMIKRRAWARWRRIPPAIRYKIMMKYGWIRRLQEDLEVEAENIIF